ncbi:hypothetical protein [Halalkalicoccus subterraneus]|uniref:hypothetical protein n=1 Tax=Halalkalicoccus subterraneus TaxID=2675002 RepID=UPI000EFBA943|nr:hypothetical protein [Halalkalicoccus subterraneus]
MVMEHYTLSVNESETRDGLDVDVYDEDDTIEASTWVGYEDYGVTPERAEDGPGPRETGFSADVTVLDLQVERDADAFILRVLGDQDTLAIQRVSDEQWGLIAE